MTTPVLTQHWATTNGTRGQTSCLLTISITKTSPMSTRPESPCLENNGFATKRSVWPTRRCASANSTTETMPREIAVLWSWNTWRWSRLIPSKDTWDTKRMTLCSKKAISTNMEEFRGAEYPLAASKNILWRIDGVRVPSNFYNIRTRCSIRHKTTNVFWLMASATACNNTRTIYNCLNAVYS